MFEIGRVYRRKELHDSYGGSRQSGISPSASHNLVLLFTGETGEQYGYNDGWNADGTFRYSGEGQTGDMTFTRGNKAIRDHVQNGKELHLFERAGAGSVRYIGQMEYAGHDIGSRVQDRDKGLRSAIVFRLAPM
jgi:5-methylcytosine-specific restriction protein A